jgi:hypothetical protein
MDLNSKSIPPEEFLITFFHMDDIQERKTEPSLINQFFGANSFHDFLS